MRFIIYFLFLLYIISCATAKKETVQKQQESQNEDNQENTQEQNDFSEKSVNINDKSISGNLINFTYSVSNNKSTSMTISQNSGQEINAILDNKLSDEKKLPKDKKKLVDFYMKSIAIMSATNREFDSVFALAKNVLEKNPNKNQQEQIKINLAVSAYKNLNFSLSKYLAEKLFLTSKDRSIKAAAANLLGIIEIKKKEYQAGISYFKLALKYDNRYLASLLNLGFLSIKFGDFNGASRYLSSVPKDWFIKSGFVVIDRWSNSPNKIDNYCSSLKGKKSEFKTILYNCALGYYQSLNKIDKASEFFTKAVNISSDDSSLDEKMYLFLDKIEMIKAKAVE